MQLPDNPGHITAGSVLYLTFNPPTKYARIEIRNNASATFAVKFNVPESDADPPTATDYHTLMKYNHRKTHEVGGEALIHTIAILAVGAGATWGTHFMVAGHQHRSDKPGTTAAVPAVPWAVPIGGYPFEVIVEAPDETIDLTGTSTTTHSEDLTSDHNTKTRIEDFTQNIAGINDSAYFGVGIYHSENHTINGSLCKHGFRFADVHNSLFDNLTINCQETVLGQSLKVTYNVHAENSNVSQHVVIQNFLTNNYCHIGTIADDNAEVHHIVYDAGRVVVAAAANKNTGIVIKGAQYVLIRDVEIDMTDRHPDFCRGISVNDDGIHLCDEIYFDNVTVKVTQSSFDDSSELYAGDATDEIEQTGISWDIVPDP